MTMLGENDLKDELSGPTVEHLLRSWRDCFDRAAEMADVFPEEMRRAAERRTVDPNEAMDELVPILAAINPDVVRFFRVYFATALQAVTEEADDTIEHRLGALETVVLGAGALLQSLRLGPLFS